MYPTTRFFALGLGLIPGLVSAAGFFGSCTTNNLFYSTLNSDCTNGWASIDLNLGISNQNGQMVFGGAGFYHSCGSTVGGNCNLNYATLGCNCKAADGSVIWSTLDLDRGLSYNGELYFQS